MNLKIQNVSLSIKGRLIVNDVSITVNPGEVVGLMGPNGAGKTTTFNLAVGNIKPDKGEIFMNGKKITNLPLPIRSRLGLGYLTQEASIFRDLTVKENIDLALQNSSYSRAAIRNRNLTEDKVKFIFIKEVSKKAYRSHLIALYIVISSINLLSTGRMIQDQFLN